MHVMLVFLFPAIFFTFVGYFIHMFKEGIKKGIYQKSEAPKKITRVGNEDTGWKNK